MVICANKVICFLFFFPKYEFTQFLFIICNVCLMLFFCQLWLFQALQELLSLWVGFFTKLLVEDEKNNTIIFFLFSVSIETLCFLLHVVVRRTHFVRYHTDRARHSWLKGQINNVMTKKHSGYQIHYDSSAEEEVISHRNNGFHLIIGSFWVGSLSICYWQVLKGFCGSLANYFPSYIVGKGIC